MTNKKIINIIKKCFICGDITEEELNVKHILHSKFIHNPIQNRILKVTKLGTVCKSCYTINQTIIDDNDILDMSFFITRNKNKIELKETKTKMEYKNLKFACYINEASTNDFSVVKLEATKGVTRDGKPNGKEDPLLYSYTFYTSKDKLAEQIEYHKKTMAKVIAGEYEDKNKRELVSIDRDLLKTVFNVVGKSINMENPTQLNIEQVLVEVLDLINNKEKKINELLDDLENKNTPKPKNKDSKVEEETKKDV